MLYLNYISYSINLLLVLIVIIVIKKVGINFIYHKINLIIYARRCNLYWESKVSQFELLQKPMDVVFVGDSLIDGFSLNEYFGKDVINRGINGEYTSSLLRRLNNTVSNPKKVYLMLGINDLNLNYTIEQITENYQKIVKILKDMNKDVNINIFSVLPIDKYKRVNIKVTNDTIDELNRGLKELCTELGLVYIDLNSQFKDSEGHLDKKYSYDGLHLNGEGYQKWYELIKL